MVATLPFVNKELVEGMFQPLITAWINREPCCVSTHPDCKYFFPAELFVTDRTSILRHIRNIYQSEELDEPSTCAKIAQVRIEGTQ